MHATPPKFGTTPIEEGDDLFYLQEYTCADCKQVFRTSRYGTRCAMCSSLVQGQVGPVKVTCPACEVEHKVSILAPHKFCPACASDLAVIERHIRHIRETLALAEQALDDAATRWDADYAHATEDDQMRYGKVCAAQDTPKYQERYQRALDKGDGLSVLLRSAARCETAIKMMEEKRRWADTALEEVRLATTSL